MRSVVTGPIATLSRSPGRVVLILEPDVEQHIIERGEHTMP
jgi:hypothetical protein